MTKVQQRSADDHNSNFDSTTMDEFGDEWSRFIQESLSPATLEQIFEDYFRIFPWQIIPPSAVGTDIGCGSGRWARVVTPRVRLLHLIDASEETLTVARRNLANAENVQFHRVSVGALPLEDGSLDFAYSLGVLHHILDTTAAICAIRHKLKPGAPLLLYLYYTFDNRDTAYRGLWWLSDHIRRGVSRLPFALRYQVSQLLALIFYWRVALLLDHLKVRPKSWPLAYYRDKLFYVMRTDSLDRFGTRLEQRFFQAEITSMLEQAGFTDIRFSERAPYWCSVARKT